MNLILRLLIITLFCSCRPNSIVIKDAPVRELTRLNVTNVTVSNDQITIRGSGFSGVTDLKVKNAGADQSLSIVSKDDATIVATTTSPVLFAVKHVLTFVFSNAYASSSFSVNFSLCDAKLGTAAFDCSVAPNDKEVLSYDASTGKWKARAINGLSYKGSWDATTSFPSSVDPGEYFIVSVAGGDFQVGDWIVWNGMSFDQIDNSHSIVSVFGRTGAVTAQEGDYNLGKLSDVTLPGTPSVGNVLLYNGSTWTAGPMAYTESDPSVQSFAKTALPVCSASEVLSVTGGALGCVPADRFTGASNRVVVTSGAGALTSSTVTTSELNFVSGVTSSIQTQLNGKLSAETDPLVAAFAKTALPTCLTGEVLRSNGTTLSCVPDNSGAAAFTGTADRVVITNGAGSLTTTTTSASDVAFLTGVSALTAKGILSVNSAGTGLSATACTTNQILKFNSSGVATCTDISTITTDSFVKGGNSFGMAASLGTSDNNSLRLITNNAERVTVTSGGFVGVGTSVANELLTVEGVLSLKEIAAPLLTPSYGKIYVKASDSKLYFMNDSGAEVELGSPNGGTPGSNTVSSSQITDGSIVDADVSGSAGISQSKIANLVADLSAKQGLDPELTALAGLTTNGLLSKTAAGSVATRSIAGTANRVVVSNGDGVSGDPTVNVDASLLPSPGAGDAGKLLQASGANSAVWATLLSSDVTSALGFAPVNKGGDTFASGVFSFGGTSVVRVLDPILPTDAANRQYVDAQIAGSSQWTTNGSNIHRSSGNVGIGVTVPRAKLDVAGPIKANLHLTNLPWHNFVQLPEGAWIPGYIKLKTPINKNEENFFSIKIIGYRYGQGGQPFEIRCNGYAYGVTGLTSAGCHAEGILDHVGVGVDTDDTIMITVGNGISGHWYYDHVTFEYSGSIEKAPEDFTWNWVYNTLPPTPNSNKVLSNDKTGFFSVETMGGGATQQYFSTKAVPDPATNALGSGVTFGWQRWDLGPTIRTVHGGDYENAGLGISIWKASTEVEALRIASSGSVGIGTTNPSERLDVSGNVKAIGFISTSDRRLKTNLEKVSGLETLERLTGYRFDWKASGETEYGVMAQEVESVLPHAVVTDPVSKIKSVRYNSLIAPVIESIKELSASDDKKDAEIIELKRKNLELEERLRRLEDLMLKKATKSK